MVPFMKLNTLSEWPEGSISVNTECVSTLPRNNPTAAAEKQPYGHSAPGSSCSPSPKALESHVMLVGAATNKKDEKKVVSIVNFGQQNSKSDAVTIWGVLLNGNWREP